MLIEYIKRNYGMGIGIQHWESIVIRDSKSLLTIIGDFQKFAESKYRYKLPLKETSKGVPSNEREYNLMKSDIDIWCNIEFNIHGEEKENKSLAKIVANSIDAINVITEYYNKYKGDTE